MDYPARCGIEYTGIATGETFSQWDVSLGHVIAIANTLSPRHNMALRYRHGDTPGGMWSRPYSTIDLFVNALLADAAGA